MHAPNLSKQIDLARVGDAIANASNTDNNSTRLDMLGYEGVVFFGALTDSAATGVAALKVEQNDADADAGMAAIKDEAGADVVATMACAINDDINGKVLRVDIYRPRKRYVQGVRTSVTANIAFGELYAIRYGSRAKPIAAHATIGSDASRTPSA